MKVLLVGKRGSIVLWLENMAAAFREAGHETRMFAINGFTPWDYLQVKLVKQFRKPALDTLLARQFEQTLRSFRPDLMLVVGAFGIPLAIYQTLASANPKPWVIGLVGDKFSTGERAKAEFIDQFYFSDTFFIDLATQAGFPSALDYLPLAVNPRQFYPRPGTRINEILFIANHTPYREELVRSIQTPVTIYGHSDWRILKKDSPHRVRAQRISYRNVARKYATYRAVLNILNERNVSYGLNQRSFEPLACRTIVINDYLRDLERCFEPQREILAYRDRDELNELCAKINHNASFGQTVATAGYRRVLAEHTYAHRVSRICQDMNL